MANLGNAAVDLAADDPRTRANAATVLGRSRGRWPAGTVETLATLAAEDPSPTVRVAALGAIARRGNPARAVRVWTHATNDPDVAIRLAAARLAPKLPVAPPTPTAFVESIIRLAADPDGYVAEAACFALGELDLTDGATVDATLETTVHSFLVGTASGHDDALVRESAVAALGSLQHPDALPTLLAACADKPAVRRRAVLALAGYDGPEVDAAIARALTDNDWQVRQAAEDLVDDR